MVANLAVVIDEGAEEVPPTVQFEEFRRRMAPALQAMVEIDALLHRLTPRETQVLGVLIDGHAITEVARRLNMRKGTVRTHFEAIRKKYNVSSIRQIQGTIFRRS